MKNPNIVFFLIDDLGWKDLTCYGSDFYETPNLDRLAEEGMRFTNAYASCPVCSPTRASIMSGKYPARVGITQFIGGANEGRLKDVPYLHYLPLEEKSLASSLRDNGYETWHIGKWHLGDEDFYPEKHGFDVNVGGCHWGCPSKGYFSPWHIPNMERGDFDGQYLTDYITDRALDLIKNRGEKPFFMHFSHYAVHTPMQAPEALIEKYRKKREVMGLDKVEEIVEGEEFTFVRGLGRNVQRRIVQSDPIYAAMVENMDTSIGRVLDALKEEGILDETLIIFTSDNGGLSTAEGSPTCNLPLKEGKGWNYEGGTRVCQIVRWPGVVEAGTVCDENVTSTDFYPTLLEAVEAELMPEQHVDGISMMPLLKGQKKLDRDAIYWHYPHYSNQGGTPAASMLSGKWKLIEFFEDNHLELYDLEADIGELNDISSENAELVQSLYAKLKAWEEEIEAKIPEPNEEFLKNLKIPKVPNNAME